jgi:hypothetical protein
MELAPIALVICVGLLLVGYLLGSTTLVAFLSSLAFGATAIGYLPALGGASPLIYAPLACLFLVSVFRSANLRSDIAVFFTQHWMPAAAAFLLVYAIGSAIIMPRLLQNHVTVFVPSMGLILEKGLSPVPGNITQSCYLAIDVLTFFAVGAFLVRGDRFRAVTVAFLTFAAVHAGLGVVDLAGKLSGTNDILFPIRTAAYTMLTETQIEGYWRIVGGYPEASSFAGASLIALAFSFSYWRTTGARSALLLAIILFVLVLLSTSTTGYVGVVVLCGTLFVCLLARAAKGRLAARDVAVLMLTTSMLILVLAFIAFDQHALDPVLDLIQATIFDKPHSASAEERFYWNHKSLAAFIETGGLGVGLGSSRASSWPLAVLSQLGVVGSALFGLLALEVFRPTRLDSEPAVDREFIALFAGVRSAAFATLVALSISAGNADPGPFFFVTVAALLSMRMRVNRRRVPLRSGHGSSNQYVEGREVLATAGRRSYEWRT